LTRVLAVPGALFPDPGTARDWLRQELSGQEYQESLMERFRRWFDELLDTVSSATGGGLDPVVALILLALLAAGIALALSRLRANPTSGADSRAVFSEARLTAAEHRGRAHAALAQEQWGEAAVEAVRALAAGLVERGLVPEQTDITVHELGERAATLFPDRRDRLEAMARVFDETRYGARPADEDAARAVVDLELELATAIPDRDRGRGAVSAVPR
jgi:hypothetical protein